MIEHAIQLGFVTVKELHMETFLPLSQRPNYAPAPGLLQFASSPFNSDMQTIQVRLKFMSGPDSSPSDEELQQMNKGHLQPFHIRAEVVGEFHVDISRFSPEQLPQWARVNAPLILLPFLREQIYSLSIRSGFQPLLLPMMLVPTLVRETSSEEPPSKEQKRVQNHLYGGRLQGLVPELRTGVLVD